MTQKQSEPKHEETNKKVKKDDIKNVKELEEKIKILESNLQKSEAEINEHKVKASQYLSTASYYKNEAENCKKDFERYKERNKNIEIDAKLKAKEDVALKIIPIIDNFDQAMSHLDPSAMKGFSMIYSSLVSTLTDLGVCEIMCKGEQLNGELHNCISTEQTDDEKLDGTIATVYQKGYKFVESEKVIRPATVSVYKI